MAQNGLRAQNKYDMKYETNFISILKNIVVLFLTIKHQIFGSSPTHNGRLQNEPYL